MTDSLLNVYNRLPISFERGEGAWVYDMQGKRYLDAYSGIAVTGLGHNHPAVTKAITEQAAKIIHSSNLIEVPQQREIGELLVELTGQDAKVFFSNSGAEAVEALIKLARLYGHSKNIAEPKVIVMTGAFHGRTMATISACSSVKVQTGFSPLLPGFVRVKYNDANAIEQACAADSSIVAVLVEPVQGESGVAVPAEGYLSQVRAICDKYNLLLLADEVQCGMGRTGKFFCYEHENVRVDAISLAKGLANGVPIGATIIAAPYYDLYKPGSHGSTFGGNPLSCAAAVATVKEITANNLMANAAKQGKKILEAFKATLSGKPHVVDVRGKGLMIGVQLDCECREILPIALKHGMIFNIANLNTIRLLPPLIIDDAQTQLIIDTVPKLVEEFVAQLPTK